MFIRETTQVLQLNFDKKKKHVKCLYKCASTEQINDNPSPKVSVAKWRERIERVGMLSLLLLPNWVASENSWKSNRIFDENLDFMF